MLFNFTPFPMLKTSRLSLNSLTYYDLDVLFVLRADPDLNKYIKRRPPQSEKDIITFVDRIHQQIREGKSINWRISLKEKDEMIGSICLWNFSDDGKIGEIGYDLLGDFHGRGIMTEAMKVILDFGFSDLKLSRIDAYTHFNNKPSISLLQKNGFVLNKDEFDEGNADNRIYSLRR